MRLNIVPVVPPVGEDHLFATLPDLRPPPLQGKWWEIKVQITCQKVGCIRFVRSNPFPSSHVSGGRQQAMAKKIQFSYVKRVLSQVISLLVGGTDILIRLEIEQSFIQLSNDILIGWITLQYFAA